MNETQFRKIQTVNDDITALTHQINARYESIARAQAEIIKYQREMNELESKREQLMCETPILIIKY